MKWNGPKRRIVVSSKLALDQRAMLFDGKEYKWRSIRDWLFYDPLVLYYHVYEAKINKFDQVYLTRDCIRELKAIMIEEHPDIYKKLMERKQLKNEGKFIRF